MTSVYSNVFYFLFILFLFTAETTSNPGEIISYHDSIPDSLTHEFVPLTRTTRQAPVEKKNEAPSADKTKTTKKPTALDTKPTNVPADGDQKQKTMVNKKETVPSKVIQSTTPSDVQEPPHISPHDEHEGDMHPGLTDGTHASTTESTSTSTRMPPKKPPMPLNNVTVPDNGLEVDKFYETELNSVGLNETLKENNITIQKVDHHLYYNSTILTHPDVFKHYWIDLDKMKDVKDVLSNSHRKAVSVILNFDFPFYGHLIRRIIIASGGFLYTGEYAHSWLTIAQYIAPLMANFGTGSSSSSSIRYYDNGTAATVQWKDVVLYDKPDQGYFNFQCTLYKNGDIVFVYKQIPAVNDNLGSDQHLVKVGLSDAYIIDRIIFFVRKKTIYEYHRVNIEKNEIRNETVIIFNALDTCLDMKDCHSCVTEIPHFNCKWCADRCSNGMDRHRQEWLTKGCDAIKRKNPEECLAEETPHEYVPRMSAVKTVENETENKMDIGISGIMGIIFVICLALGIGIWLFYAYRNPHTPAGQFLIRYRPSQWSWRRGEARYTAATIHM